MSLASPDPTLGKSYSPVDEALQQRRRAAIERRPLLIVLIAAAAGIVFDRLCSPPFAALWTLAALSWIGWLIAWRIRRENLAFFLLLFATAVTFAGWHHWHWNRFAQDDLGRFATDADQPVCLKGFVGKSPVFRRASETNDPLRVIPVSDSVAMEIEPTQIRDGQEWRTCSGRARVSIILADDNPAALKTLLALKAGDPIQIFGRFSKVPPAMNPGEFDFRNYSRTYRQIASIQSLSAACVQLLTDQQRPSGFSLRAAIDHVRQAGRAALERNLDPENSNLAAAILLGLRDGLDRDDIDAWRRTGTVHMLAISGLHLGILAGILMFIALRLPLPRVISLGAVALFVTFYMLATDARPPIVRATILVVIACLAQILYRRTVSINTLAAAALVLLIVNPSELFQIGTQLSFLAVASIILFAAPWSDRMTERLDGLLQQRIDDPDAHIMLRSFGTVLIGAVAVSATIWLVSMPLVMSNFHLFTPVAVPLNVLLWIPMTIALVSGFGVLVLGVLAPPLAVLPAWVCNQSLDLIRWSVDQSAAIPAGHHWVAGPETWWVAGFYLGIALLMLTPLVRVVPLRWRFAALATWIMVGTTAAVITRSDDRLQCTFVAVGHGSATVVRLPDGRTLLVDAGRLGSPRAGVDAVSGTLWAQGTTHIDAVVLSHPDADHYNILPGLLERFSVSAVYTTPMMFAENSSALNLLETSIRQRDIPIRKLMASDRLDAGDECTIEIMHPPRGQIYGSDNETSLVLRIDFRGRTILLPADIDRLGLADLMQESALKTDILLAPHHGSTRSNPPGFCDWCNPKEVVMSGTRPRGDRLDDVEATYKESGAEFLSTFETGTIRYRLDADRVERETYLQP